MDRLETIPLYNCGWEGGLNFSDGFTELHNKSYEQILMGNGYGLDDIRPTIKLIEDIRSK